MQQLAKMPAASALRAQGGRQRGAGLELFLQQCRISRAQLFRNRHGPIAGRRCLVSSRTERGMCSCGAESQGVLPSRALCEAVVGLQRVEEAVHGSCPGGRSGGHSRMEHPVRRRVRRLGEDAPTPAVKLLGLCRTWSLTPFPAEDREGPLPHSSAIGPTPRGDCGAHRVRFRWRGLRTQLLPDGLPLRDLVIGDTAGRKVGGRCAPGGGKRAAVEQTADGAGRDVSGRALADCLVGQSADHAYVRERREEPRDGADRTRIRPRALTALRTRRSGDRWGGEIRVVASKCHLGAAVAVPGLRNGTTPGFPRQVQVSVPVS